MKQALTAQQQLPPEERNDALTALDSTLATMANIVVHLHKAAEPTAPGTIQAEAELLHFLFPFSALKGALGTAEEAGLAGNSYLEMLGPNNPHFDGLLNALNQLQTAVKTVHGLSAELVISPDNQLSPTASALAALAHTQLSSLAAQLEAVNLGSDLQLIGPTVKALDHAVAALTLPYAGSAPLYLSLAMANPGETAGTQLNALLTLIGNGVADSTLGQTPAGKNFFHSLLTSTALAWVGMTGEIYKQSAASYPSLEGADLAHAASFGSELFLTTAASSGMMEQVYGEAVAVSGGNAHAQQLGASALAAFAYSLASQGNHTAGNSLSTASLSDLTPTLSRGAAAAEQLTEESKNGSAAGAAFSQMQLALEEKDEEGFAHTSSTLLEESGTPAATLKNELSTFQEKVHYLIGSLGSTGQDLTGIVNIV
jgi:hypothetical protein